MGEAIRLRAYAKINLDLRILDLRADGFHEVRTVYQTIALHDTIEMAPHDGAFRIACDADGVPLDQSNLIWRAADALWRALGRQGEVHGVTVRLEKRIPPQAGLGGGSTDAAAALVGLAHLWQVPAGQVALADVAARLGADVPFFLTGGTALGLGRGDEIRPLPDLPHYWIVLIVPDFGVSTAEAYGWYDAAVHRARSGPLQKAPVSPERLPIDLTRVVNDLEVPVAIRHPEIDRMKAALRDAGALTVSMSGSGSTVFGLFPDDAMAAAAVGRLSSSSWRVVLTESLNRGDYAKHSQPVLTETR